MKSKILIVDDSVAWLSFHTETINELYGDLFEITVANSATSALNVIRKNTGTPYTIVITDLQMEVNYSPKLAGEWLVENIKAMKECATTKIVIISGMHNIELIAKKLEVDCISKSMLIRNKLLIKYMFEKLMPFLTKI